MTDPIAATPADSRRKRIGLCLSGGGFRAALFHLGALRRLDELGLLAEVDTASSVSGGSILSAFLAQRMSDLARAELGFDDFEAEVAAPFRRFTERDLRTLPILLHLPWNWLWPDLRVRHLARSYRRHLTRLTLGELPARPAFVYCATDMAFGVGWTFRRAESGDYQIGYTSETGTWPLARAVAASSSFPPVFGPGRVGLAADKYRRGEASAATRQRMATRIRLTDGGVYDNMGLEPVWRSHEYVLVSDCGAPFRHDPSETVLRRLLRYTGIVTSQTVALRQRLFFAGLKSGGCRGTYWSLGTMAAPPLGYPLDLVEEVLERVRTDLDHFSDREARVLENHGYAVAAERLAAFVPELGGVAAPALPHPDLADEAAARAALRESHKRLSWRRLLRWT